MEYAYRVNPPMPNSEYKKKIQNLANEYSDLARDQKPRIVPLNKGIELHFFRSNSGGVWVFIVGNEKVLGLVDLWNMDPGPSYKINYSAKTSKLFLEPHSLVIPEARGQGLAQVVYEFTLRQGFILFTKGHYKDASILWDRLNKTWAGGLLYYDQGKEEVRAPSTATELQGSYRFLLGKGRTYKDVIPLGWAARILETSAAATRPRYTGRYTIHETSYKAALSILKMSYFKGNKQPEIEEQSPGYGDWVYTCVFSDPEAGTAYFGVTDNQVLFVIDVKATWGRTRYEPESEGGLLSFYKAIPLSAVTNVFIFGSQSNPLVRAIAIECGRNHREFAIVPRSDRAKIIRKFCHTS